MIKQFFLDKFEYDFQCNKAWSKLLKQHEDRLDDFCIRSFSHLINVHHRWIARLEDVPSESDLFDRLPLIHWDALLSDNYNRTAQFIEHVDFPSAIQYYSDEGEFLEKETQDVLYHMLNHSNYHRAQISLNLRNLEIIPPSLNFISFK